MKWTSALLMVIAVLGAGCSPGESTADSTLQAPTTAATTHAVSTTTSAPAPTTTAPPASPLLPEDWDSHLVVSHGQTIESFDLNGTSQGLLTERQDAVGSFARVAADRNGGLFVAGRDGIVHHRPGAAPIVVTDDSGPPTALTFFRTVWLEGQWVLVHQSGDRAQPRAWRVDDLEEIDLEVAADVLSGFSIPGAFGRIAYLTDFTHEPPGINSDAGLFSGKGGYLTIRDASGEIIISLQLSRHSHVPTRLEDFDGQVAVISKPPVHQPDGPHTYVTIDLNCLPCVAGTSRPSGSATIVSARPTATIRDGSAFLPRLDSCSSSERTYYVGSNVDGVSEAAATALFELRRDLSWCEFGLVQNRFENDDTTVRLTEFSTSVLNAAANRTPIAARSFSAMIEGAAAVERDGETVYVWPFFAAFEDWEDEKAVKKLRRKTKLNRWLDGTDQKALINASARRGYYLGFSIEISEDGRILFFGDRTP